MRPETERGPQPVVCFLVRCALPILFLLPLTGLGQTPPPDHLEFFERSIRPVLVERCVECHGKVRAESGLRLDSRAALLKGGENGAVVDLKNPVSSKLLVAVRHEGAKRGVRDMPKNAPKLAADEIGALQKWIELGLPWPASAAPVLAKKDPRGHWSLRPLRVEPNLPEGVHPIDFFVQRALRAKGLTQAPGADAATLVRRLHFVLTGLPPTHQEFSVWSREPAEKLIDHLLASPHYGERWARHWMDVARYSDVRGYTAGGRERRFVYAFVYRDWLIRAFNADLPYDQFVRLQLAADQVTKENDRAGLAAMGFLTLANDAVRREILIDDQIDTTFRGLMGLTVSCARCHDHKFDPIPTKDYYSLYGIFDNSVPPAAAPVIASPAGTPEYRKFEADLAVLEKSIADFLQPRFAEIAKQFPDLANRPAALEPKLERGDQTKLRELRNKRDKFIADSPHAPDRALILEDRPKPAVAHVFVRGNPGNRGEAVKPRFLTAVAGDEAPVFTNGSGRLELANAIVDTKNPLTARVLVNRVWMHHFGQGLVRTASDFGVQGQTPDHPELLDWLADWFMRQGWSVKKLHRLILTSETWQQGCVHPQQASQELIDPENRLLWRAHLRRIDFETMRDSLLSVSGQLDPRLFGRSVEIDEPPFPGRRSLYAYIDRQNLPQVFTTFDFASPQAHVGQRSYTTVATQALFVLNSPFLLDQARRIAALPGLAGSQGQDAVTKLYRRIFGRDPSREELAMGAAFLEKQKGMRLKDNRQTQSDWQYGMTQPNPAGGSEIFQPFPQWLKRRWQVDKVYPAPAPLTYAALHQTGGHPGNPGVAVIARWTAPGPLSVKVTATLRKGSERGDGVRLRIIRNGSGVLQETICQPAKRAAAETGPIEVAAGDTLDFRVDAMEQTDSDSFEWSLALKSLSGNHQAWDYAEDFDGPADPANPLEIYAQALVSTNEFAFVD
ncbi:MAG: DUF1553 domain-containing protein [Verrucomicrobia bacterium]|nr:DUF1553 domain-containing protein [Verrucomicrobiota bacterium]